MARKTGELMMLNGSVCDKNIKTLNNLRHN